MFIDSHAHLELEEYDHDRDEVVQRAKDAGVEVIITIGIDLADGRKAVALTERYDGVYAAIGVHPHDAGGIDDKTYAALKDLAKNKKVVAYGEIGLDFYRNLSAKDIQIRRFGEQLDVAIDLDLPIIIHDRDAHEEIYNMLKPWAGKRRGVIHCFSGDAAMAKRFLDLGFYISIPGPVTFQKASKIQNVVRQVPLASLLIETDAPFLTPDPHRGKRNEPAFVVHTAKKIAEIKGISVEEVGLVTARNTKALFAIPDAVS
ncbi:MAG: TatD family hydrolase [Deltaproteobacteria bacterium]|nr:TatD family hydrolase [Deltaproteobacteria bacterium]